MSGAVDSLRAALADVEELQRERDEAQVQADRLGQANGDLCDDIATAGERIRELETVLTWFAERGSPLAQAVLLGMGRTYDDVNAVHEAWAKREGRAA